MNSENSGRTTAYVAIGSNISPERNITAALERLQKQTGLTDISRFYKTTAINRPEQPDYLNGMARVECVQTPRMLKYDVLRAIEEELGRRRTDDRFAPRTIDLDLTIFGNLLSQEDGLVLPDPDLRARPFMLAALLDLCPDMILPDTGEPITSLLNDDERRSLRPAAAFTRQLRERLGL